ncbi:MAG: hypothetical protein ACE5K4_11300 [Candidatus Hydrothermarchaeota archaeon]
MKEIANKIRSLEREIVAEKGELTLFALFLREDAPDKWDLLASGPGLEENKKEALVYLVQKIRSHLDLKEFITISRIVLLEKENPVLNAIQRAVKVEHGLVEVKESVFFGLKIKHAYIFTSKRHKANSNSNKLV